MLFSVMRIKSRSHTCQESAMPQVHIYKASLESDYRKYEGSIGPPDLTHHLHTRGTLSYRDECFLMIRCSFSCLLAKGIRFYTGGQFRT